MAYQLLLIFPTGDYTLFISKTQSSLLHQPRREFSKLLPCKMSILHVSLSMFACTRYTKQSKQIERVFIECSFFVFVKYAKHAFLKWNHLMIQGLQLVILQLSFPECPTKFWTQAKYFIMINNILIFFGKKTCCLLCVYSRNFIL